MNLLRQRRTNVFVELLLGAAVQIGLARALSRACLSADEREARELDAPRRIRPRAPRPQAARRGATAPTR